MGRAIDVLLALVSIGICEAAIPIIVGCGVTNMSACNTSAWDNITLATKTTPVNKLMMCQTRDIFETCTLVYGQTCANTTRQIYKDAVRQLAWVVNVQYGFDCSRTLASTTLQPLQASSGDSGSGSQSSGSNEIIGSSGSGAYKWQWWVLLLLLFCCCLAALGGLAAALMSQKKKKRTQRLDRQDYERDYEMDQPPMLEQPPYEQPPYEQPPYAEPPVIEDRALEPPPVIQAVEAPVPAAVPIVETQPMTDMEKLYLFGQPQPMLQTVPTASMTGTQSYDEGRSITYPMASPMASYYTQAPGSYYATAQEQPTYYYAQPTAYTYAAAEPQYTYAAAEPQYTTSYAVNPGYQPQYAAGQVI